MYDYLMRFKLSVDDFVEWLEPFTPHDIAAVRVIDMIKRYKIGP